MPPSRQRFTATLRATLTPVMIGTAFVLFAVGVAAPFFSVTKMWVFKDAVSVMSGLVSLAGADEWFLFAIIFLFTIVFPLVKLGVLTAVWWYRDTDDDRADRLLRRESSLGKWSMLDVFVVAILVVMLKSASLASMQVGIGVYLFTASVILTQFISIRLEHRLRRRRRQAAGEPAPADPSPAAKN